jgi:hypothetical protein
MLDTYSVQDHYVMPQAIFMSSRKSRNTQDIHSYDTKQKYGKDDKKKPRNSRSDDFFSMGNNFGSASRREYEKRAVYKVEKCHASGNTQSCGKEVFVDENIPFGWQTADSCPNAFIIHDALVTFLL